MSSLLNSLARDPWKGLSFDAPSKGVIACDGHGNGVVLWAIGAHLRFEMEECGLSCLGDLGLDDAPEGISVWEGKYIWQSGGWECQQDGEMYPKGSFRSPTDEEWQAIRAGSCPWKETPCVCGSGPVGSYDGPSVDCPTHGDFHRVLG